VSGDDQVHFKPARWSKDDGTLVFEVSSEGYIEKGTSIDVAVVLINLPRKMIAKCQVRIVTVRSCHIICDAKQIMMMSEAIRTERTYSVI
jgi:hypothetical protein